MPGVRFSGQVDIVKHMRWTKLIVGVIAALIVSYLVWWVFFTPDFINTHGSNASNRATLIKVRENIRIGDSYENVLRAYWQHRSPDLRLDPVNPQLWLVSMPNEIFAKDWVMYIDFSDGRVSVIRVRTSDGPPPSDAPEDVSK